MDGTKRTKMLRCLFTHSSSLLDHFGKNFGELFDSLSFFSAETLFAGLPSVCEFVNYVKLLQRATKNIHRTTTCDRFFTKRNKLLPKATYFLSTSSPSDTSRAFR
jgi:hypothetical protein